MSSIVFVLGAGASKQCGAPLMFDFLDIAADLYWSGRVAAEKQEHFQRVLEVIGHLQKVHSKAQFDLNNLESIFTALELGKVIQRIPGLKSEEIEQAILSLKEVIVATLEMTMLYPVDGPSVFAPEPYAEFAKLLKLFRDRAMPRHSASVISFNYDIAADLALYRQNLGPDYVIERTGVPDPVPLLKLHGSLNWATQKATRQIRPMHMVEFLGNVMPHGYSQAILPVGSRIATFFKELGTEVEAEPVIVPPSWNKADYHTALTSVWAAAATKLAEAEYIFVIGYSLPPTDSFFRHLYALGSASDVPLRKFMVFNPDKSSEMDERFRSLLGPGALARYEYLPLTFADAIPRIASLFKFEEEGR